MTLCSIRRAPADQVKSRTEAALPHGSHPFPERVAVTGADGFVGQALMLRLLEVPTPVVGLVRDASSMAVRVVSGPLDSLAAQSALGRSECVVHLAGGLRPRPGDSLEAANVETARALAHAVKRTGVRRIIYLSCVGATPGSHNRYRAAKGIAEWELRNTGCDLIVLRCTHIVGPPKSPGAFASSLLQRRGHPVWVPGNGSQLIAPVAIEDVVTAILRAAAWGWEGVYELAGPDLFDFDEFVELLNGPQVQIRHLAAPFARLLAPVMPGPSSALVDLLLRDCVGDSTPAMLAFGLHLTSLRRTWSASTTRENATLAWTS